MSDFLPGFSHTDGHKDTLSVAVLRTGEAWFQTMSETHSGITTVVIPRDQVTKLVAALAAGLAAEAGEEVASNA